jgi:hypothetical protein
MEKCVVCQLIWYSIKNIICDYIYTTKITNCDFEKKKIFSWILLLKSQSHISYSTSMTIIYLWKPVMLKVFDYGFIFFFWKIFNWIETWVLMKCLLIQLWNLENLYFFYSLSQKFFFHVINSIRVFSKKFIRISNVSLLLICCEDNLSQS